MNEGSALDAYTAEDRGSAIGAGGQYTAYDVGDGRVLKWPNSLEEATRIVSTMPEVEDPPKLARMVSHLPGRERAARAAARSTLSGAEFCCGSSAPLAGERF